MQRPEFPIKKDVMVVVDYPIQMEVDTDTAYNAPSHHKLMNSLYKVGITQDNCNFTYLSYERPKKDNSDYKNSFKKHKDLETLPEGLGWGGELYHKLEHQKDLYISDSLYNDLQALLEHIRKVEPFLIVIGGKWSLFLLTGLGTFITTHKNLLGNVGKYRASILKIHECFGFEKEIVLFPIYPPALSFKLPEKVHVIHWDYLKLGDIYKSIKENFNNFYNYYNPTYNFKYGLDFKENLQELDKILQLLSEKELILSVDIETRSSTIDCIGFCYKPFESLCIGFSTVSSPSLWSEKEEFILVSKIEEILNHEHTILVGQNFSYDAQYIWSFWVLKLRPIFESKKLVDTMVINHVLYNYLPKSLDVLASIYCDDYTYWKDMQDFGK